MRPPRRPPGHGSSLLAEGDAVRGTAASRARQPGRVTAGAPLAALRGPSRQLCRVFLPEAGGAAGEAFGARHSTALRGRFRRSLCRRRGTPLLAKLRRSQCSVTPGAAAIRHPAASLLGVLQSVRDVRPSHGARNGCRAGSAPLRAADTRGCHESAAVRGAGAATFTELLGK